MPNGSSLSAFKLKRSDTLHPVTRTLGQDQRHALHLRGGQPRAAREQLFAHARRASDYLHGVQGMSPAVARS